MATKPEYPRILSILVENHPGALSRISGLFSRRGYNIDSLTVSATEDERFSRMTITLKSTDTALNQILAQLEKQVDVICVSPLSDNTVAFRELLLLKIACSPEQRGEIVDICTIYKAKTVDISADTMMLELTGRPAKIDSFIELVAHYNIIEMARTGGVALQRGKGSLKENV